MLILEKFTQKYFTRARLVTHHVTNSMSAMHTFSMCNENDENAAVKTLIELWDILTLLLYGMDVCLLWGLTKALAAFSASSHSSQTKLPHKTQDEDALLSVTMV